MGRLSDTIKAKKGKDQRKGTKKKRDMIIGPLLRFPFYRFVEHRQHLCTIGTFVHPNRFTQGFVALLPCIISFCTVSILSSFWKLQ